MVCIDISNSQPYLLAGILRPEFWTGDITDTAATLSKLPYSTNYIHNYPIPDIITLCNFFKTYQPHDVECFINIVSNGNFYETMAALSPKKTGRHLSRNEVKDMMFMVLFTDNTAVSQPWAKRIRDFKDIFPNVYDFIRLVKQQQGRNLPLLLQRLESWLIYDRVMPRLACEYPRLPVFTIHDGIATVTGHEGYVATVIREELHKAIGHIPSFKYEYWRPDKVKENLYWHQTMLDTVIDAYNFEMKSALGLY